MLRDITFLIFKYFLNLIYFHLFIYLFYLFVYLFILNLDELVLDNLKIERNLYKIYIISN
jgi:hypothetical protein